MIDCVIDSKVEIETMDALFNAKNWPDAYFCHAWGGAKRRNPDMECLLKAKQQSKKF